VVERLVHTEEVTGSNPVVPISNRLPCGSLFLHVEERRMKRRTPHVTRYSILQDHLPVRGKWLPYFLSLGLAFSGFLLATGFRGRTAARYDDVWLCGMLVCGVGLLLFVGVWTLSVLDRVEQPSSRAGELTRKS
jgi:hypothetical protein